MTAMPRQVVMGIDTDGGTDRKETASTSAPTPTSTATATVSAPTAAGGGDGDGKAMFEWQVRNQRNQPNPYATISKQLWTFDKQTITARFASLFLFLARLFNALVCSLSLSFSLSFSLASGSASHPWLRTWCHAAMHRRRPDRAKM